MIPSNPKEGFVMKKISAFLLACVLLTGCGTPSVTESAPVDYTEPMASAYESRFARETVIRLSDSVYDSTSTAAIGVACHEAGHAVQYAQDYAPIKLRAAIIPITNFGSKIAMPLILIGILLSALGNVSYTFVYLGIAAFSLSLVFQLVTLPVEFNASRRAMQAIESANILTEEEQRGARKTLKAAAMTYVAATAVSLAQLLRLILIFGGRSRRRD